MAFNLAQINALVNAGYKLEEILEVNGPVENPVEPVENPAPAPAPAPAPVSAPDPAPAPAPETDNKAILDAINNLTQVIQAGNIRMGGFPAPAGQITAEEVLANIINPPGYTAGKNK